MKVSEFEALSKDEKALFESIVDMADTAGFELFTYLAVDCTRYMIYTERAIHLLKHCI